MRKVLATAIAVFFVVSLVGVVNMAVAKEKGDLYLRGEVVSVDQTAKTLTVKGKKGEETIAVDQMTKISMGKMGGTLEDIKAGDYVRVKYHKVDGKDVAYSVSFHSEHAKAAGMKPEAK